ncbi:hypothetical protein NIA69_17155 [Gemmiger formicilis]|nr:hypothetical protein [Gemmiger formicilis]
MEELTHDFLSFLPATLLALAAAGAPEVYKLAARRFLGRTKVTQHRGFTSCWTASLRRWRAFSGTAGRGCRQVAAV